MNSTQAGIVSLFFLCVWCGSWLSREHVLLVAPGWCAGCLPCAPLPQLSLTRYFVLMRPILPAFSSVNQRSLV